MKSEQFTIKELAGHLKRHRNFVGAMVAQGFPMPGGRATLEEARAWLISHPKPRSRCNAVRGGASAGVH